MIDRNTVFIIGAGGSYPYGFPLGIELRQLAYGNAEYLCSKNLLFLLWMTDVRKQKHFFNIYCLISNYF
jgi:hypothetical protein